MRWYAESIEVNDVFFFSSRRRHTRLQGDWSSDVCSSDLHEFDAALRSADDRLPAFDRQVDRAGHQRQLQMGRAACRARVEMSVVAESLKKQRLARLRERDEARLPVFLVTDPGGRPSDGYS